MVDGTGNNTTDTSKQRSRVFSKTKPSISNQINFYNFPMKLFDESDDIKDISKIETDNQFARRYEHNKKREELQRLEELKKKGIAGDDSESESDEEEDEDDEDLIRNDIKFCEALSKIKNAHPVIYQKDAKLFESEEEERREKKKKEKPKYLKDVVAKQLMEDGPELEEEEEDRWEERRRPKSYMEEREEDVEAVLRAIAEVDDDDEGELLKEKKRRGGEEGDVEVQKKKWDECLGDDENEMFLKDFFVNKRWKDENKRPEDLMVLSEDEEEVMKQEKYEVEYNFRFEEGAGDRVLGHARVMEGSVRKKTNARKNQRKSKEERMAQAEFERKEELKHLKNLKKKEIEEKLEKIRAIAGITEDGACALNEDDLEEDFDPDEYDKKMKETFDVDYYGADDAGFCSDGEDIEKPDFDKEDELLGLPKDWDVCGSGGGFIAVREKVLNHKVNGEDVDMADDGEGEGEENDNSENEAKVDERPEEGKRKRKRKIPLREKVALDKELEEYYKLDYEDTIGDLKTRFRYTSVPAQRFGLKPTEILSTDEKELNQYVSIKKLAPYREKEWKVPEMTRYQWKMRNKSGSKGVNLEDQKSGKKRKLKDADEEQGNNQVEESNGDMAVESRKSRRRRRQAELKLSVARRIAYGQIPAKSKSKKKH